MAMPLFWSVERDDGAVVAICPEPLRPPSETRPAWMEHCASAIREELRLLASARGTLLAATMTGEPGGVELERVLLSHRGIPQAHVHDGVRLGLRPPVERGVVLRYRREPIAPGEPADAGAVVATLLVPVNAAYELEPGTAEWLAEPAGGAGCGVALHARFVAGVARVHGSVELIEALLENARASLSAAGASPDIRHIDVVFEPGDSPQIEVELRAIADADADSDADT